VAVAGPEGVSSSVIDTQAPGELDSITTGLGTTPQQGVGQSMSCYGNAGAGSMIPIPGTRTFNNDVTLTKVFPLRSDRRQISFPGRRETYNRPTPAWDGIPRPPTPVKCRCRYGFISNSGFGAGHYLSGPLYDRPQ
jgi:hypothetical protein